MNACHRLAVTTGLIMVNALASARADAPVMPAMPASQPVPFVVTLNVPNSPGKNYFDLNDPKSSFDITIKNVSSMPQTIWKDWCSDGYYTIHLEVMAINGKTLPKALALTRGMRAWSKNFPDPEMLKPGEETTRQILVSELNEMGYVLSIHHQKKPIPGNDGRVVYAPDFPRLDAYAQSETVKACAVLDTLAFGNSPVGNARYGVWSGRVVSAPVTFTMRLPLPPIVK